MRCINKKIGKLLFLYEFEKLSPGQKDLFEAHLLECDYCFQQLHNLAPVVKKMRDDPYAFYPALVTRPKTPWYKKLLSTIKSMIWQPVWASAPLARPAFVVALLALVVLIGVQFWPGSPQNYAGLARIEPVRYIPLNTKGAYDRTNAEQLFIEGMQLYAKHQYLRAATKLDSARAYNPEDIGTQFYLGLNYLLAEKPDSAIIYFQKVIANGDNPFIEKSHWYLGNAWLLREDAKQALEEFEKVMKINGTYKWKAEEILNNINKLNKDARK